MVADTDVGAAALSYIARGWAVIPLHDVASGRCSCGSADEPRHSTSQGGKHPLGKGWQNRGITTAETVAQVWTPRSPSNIGIVTGRASGIWVLDIDPEHGGDRALTALVVAYGGLPETWTVQTGSGGRHYYWRMPDFDFTTSRGRLPVGLDVRGNSGQVVAPPSYTLKGQYRVLVDADPAPAPDWLLDLIRPAVRAEETDGADVVGPWEGSAPQHSGGTAAARVDDVSRGSEYARAAVRGVLAELANAVPGTRNETAYKVGRRLAELVYSPWTGLDERAVYEGFMAAALACDTDGGFSQTEAEQVLRKAIRAQAGRGVPMPVADFYGTLWAPPPMPPGVIESGAMTDFDQAGQGPAVNPFSAPGMGTSTNVAAPLINEYAEQPKLQDPWEDAVSREVSRLLVRAEAEKRVAARGLPEADFDREALDIVGLRGIPPLQPLVDGWFHRDTLARINGPSGHGKSFVAVDLTCCVGAGRTWHGHAVTRMPTLYVVAEGAAGMRGRIEAWQTRHEVADEDLGVTFLARAVQIGGPEWPPFVAWCAKRGFGMITLDTQARATVGRKENDATEMGEVVAALDELRQATGACVSTVHHRGLSGEHGRGSTAMRGAMDTEMDVSRAGATLTVKITKAKDTAEPAAMLLTMNSLGASMVLVADSDRLTPDSPFVAPSVSLTGQQRAALAISQALIEASGSGLTRAEALNHARVAMGLPGTETVKRMIRRAWSDVMDLGRVAKADGREAYFWIDLEGAERMAMNPDKTVQGGPERYIPGAGLAESDFSE